MQANEQVLRAACQFVAWNWPVLPIRPGTKEPLTRHGVKDATLDEVQVHRWWNRWPDANLAVATGAPGPHVLDIDDPAQAGDWIARLREGGAPEVATSRGSHFYFAGRDVSTVTLAFGELRGRGGYVLVPPSTHPSGKAYVWLTEPTDRLFPVPSGLTADTGTRGLGTGPTAAPTFGLVGEGHRHHALSDRTIRLVRGGITDPVEIAAMLAGFVSECCAPGISRREIDDLARWASGTDIAERERRWQESSR